MKNSIALFLIAGSVLSTGARGQIDSISTHSPSPNCPLATEITPQHLYGLWRAEFEGLHQGATLLLKKHPELSGSVSGGIARDGVKAQIAGDVEQGEFTLEESFDGQHISATWEGVVSENSCGKEIKGSWKPVPNGSTFSFILHKLPSWQ